MTEREGRREKGSESGVGWKARRWLRGRVGESVC